MVDPEPETVREAKRRWAELLRRILEVDPLACPRCGEEMRKPRAVVAQGLVRLLASADHPSVAPKSPKP